MKTVTMIRVMVLGVILACGCATTTKGPSDQELIEANTAGCIKAAEAGDIEKLLTYYSDDFSHYEFGDKDGFKTFLLDAKDMGYIDGIEIDNSNAQTTIEGDKATVSSVSVSGGFGSTNIDFELVKEDGDWKISGMDLDI